LQMPLNQEAFAKCANLSDQAYYVLHNRLATYADLSTHLTLEDAITLAEFHQVSEHNNALLEGLRDEFRNSR